MVGNIESGLTSTVKSWIIGFKTAPAACHIVWKDMAVSEDQDSCAESKYGRKRVHGTVERIPGSPGIQGTDSGGGSAAAVYGAIGTALGEMVGNLTSGKKKFAIYEEDVQKILARLGGARMDFIRLEKADRAGVSATLGGLPHEGGDEGREDGKGRADGRVPEGCGEGPDGSHGAGGQRDGRYEFLALHGSRLAVSDAGVGIQGIRSALLGAVMSVYINTKMMKDREYAEEMNSQAELLIRKGTEQADRIYGIVLKAVRG